MKAKLQLVSVLAIFAIAFLLHSSSLILAQGPLVPPGAPAPTMKTLDQLDTHLTQAGEKRIEVQSLAGDASSQFIINIGGSYYLSGNIVGVAPKNGISIQANNVTLDLNGFAVIGVTGTLSGVTVDGVHNNIAVRNGTVRGWGSGGVQATTAYNSEFDRIRAMDDFSSGSGYPAIETGGHCSVTNCLVQGTLSGGIVIGDQCTVSGCTAQGNGGLGEGGIRTGGGCTITACTADDNTSVGISAGDGSTVIACTTRLNQRGILVQDRCTVSGCTTTGNSFEGIVSFGNGCYLLNNNASGNGHSGIEVGDDPSGFGGNRIEGNHLRSNGGNGILIPVGSTSNVVMRNTAGNNAIPNYNISSGNAAPVINSSSINTATNPFANIQD